MRRARAQVRRLLAVAARMAARRVAVVAAAAMSVAAAALAVVAGSDLTDALLLLVFGAVVTGVLHGHRQRRLLFGAMHRGAGDTGDPVVEVASETLNRQKLTALTLTRLSEDLAAAAGGLHELISRQGERTTAEVEALLRLDALVRAYGRASPTRVRTTHPAAALAAVDELGNRRPKLAVVCGDAVTAVWCVLASEHLRLDTRIVALDHDAGRVAAARRWLSDLDLDRRAEIRHSALAPVHVQGCDGHWYDRSAWADLVDIGLLSVTAAGAPGENDPTAITPALTEILAVEATVVLTGFSSREVEAIARTARWSLREDRGVPAAAVLVVGEAGR